MGEQASPSTPADGLDHNLDHDLAPSWGRRARIWLTSAYGHFQRSGTPPPIQESDQDDVTWILTRHPSCVRQARRLTRAQLADWKLRGQEAVAEQVVCELVTDALRHAGGPIRLSLYLVDGTLRCEVEDGDTVLPPTTRHPGTAGTDAEDGHGREPEREPGREPHLIERLSCCWGRVRTATGKAVWVEFPATRALHHSCGKGRE